MNLQRHQLEFLNIILKLKIKSLLKNRKFHSGHNRDDYIVERLNCPSHDGRQIPITITYHKDTKLDGSAHMLMYGYGSYGSAMTPTFSTARFSLIERNIIWATCHIRGGFETRFSLVEGGQTS